MDYNGQEWRQHPIACFGGFSLLLAGYALGWTSPIIIKLAKPDQSPLPEPITVDQEAWIGSLISIGALFGPFIGGFAAAKLGRKWALSAACIPLLASWILNAVATDVAMIYVARFCVGLYVGMTFTVTPLYLGEIATNKHRGAVLTLVSAFLTSGFLLVYSIGPYVSYWVVTYVAIALSVCFFVGTLFIPESPYFYLIKGDMQTAGECLMKIRGKTREGVQSELEKLTLDVQLSMKNSARLIDVFRGTNLTALYLSCGLMMVQQLCGINAVLFYMTNIFDAAGTTLDPAISTIIVGGIQVLLTPLTPLLTHRFGGRLLMIVTSAGATIAHVLIAVYFQLDKNGHQAVETIGFLPMLSLILFVIMYSWGLGPIPLGFVAEVTSVEIRPIAMSIVISYCWFLSFIVTRFFGPLAHAVGMAPIFWIFGGCCCLAFIFVWFLMPETKGKSFQEIQNLLIKS